MPTQLPVLVSMVLLAALLPSPNVWAQQQSREREALRRAQQQVSKLQQETAALQAQRAEMETKLKAAEAELAKLKPQVGRLRKSASALSAAQKEKAVLSEKLIATEGRLKQTTQKLQDDRTTLQKTIAETRAELAQTQQNSQQSVGTLQASLKTQTDRAAICEEKNRQLYSVTMDLIGRYKQSRGAWEKFLLAEPFTGLKSVEVENLLEDMRDQAADNRVTAPTGAAQP